MSWSVGVDFGSLSARAVLMDTDSGEILASETCEYANGILTDFLPDGTPLPQEASLQLPSDYRNALFQSVRGLVQKAGVDPKQIIGIGIDATSCTVLPVSRDGTPLCEKEKYCSNPHAYIKMWRHHSAKKYAEIIAERFRLYDALRFQDFGSFVSSEHFLPKVTETVLEAPDVYQAAYAFMEVGDWLVYLLTGRFSRGYCAAAYKTYYDPDKGDLPGSFLKEIHPSIANLPDKYASPIVHPGDCVGVLTQSASEQTGLPAGIPVSAAGLDAHTTVIGCGITEPESLLLVIGTSSCAMALNGKKQAVKGLNGVVRDGILPDMYAYEGGQSGVGDMFAWYADRISPWEYRTKAGESGVSVQQLLTEKAALLKPGSSGLLALDWFNGVRSTLMDFSLTGTIIGLTCETRPEELYRALLEASAFGAKKIVSTMEESGLHTEKLYAAGGIPLKNPLMMQIYADVFDKKINVVDSRLSGASGSAILGCAAGSGVGFRGLTRLTQKLGAKHMISYFPDKENTIIYRQLYELYDSLYSFFGENDIMHRLNDIKHT